MATLNVLCFLLLLNYVVTDASFHDDNLISEKLVSNLNIIQSVISTTDTTLGAMKTLQTNMLLTAQSIVDKNQEDIKLKMSDLKKNITDLKNKRSTSIINQCIKEENPLDILIEAISNEVKQCITVSLAENVNIISGCIVEAQTFMDLPQKVAADLQACGPAQQCLFQISLDAVNESMEIPSKVLVLTARIQQLAYHSLSSINGCALNGLIKVVQQGISIVEDIVACVEQTS